MNDPILDKLAGAPAAAAPAEAAAAEAAAPQTPEEARYRYKMKIGGEERELTDEQISGTFERYRDLNYKHASMKPVLDLAEEISRRTGAAPDAVAKYIQDMMANGGQQQAPQQAAAAPDDDAMLTKWEEENAAALPPGYRDMRKGIRSVADGQAQLMQMLQDVMQSSKGVADAARAAQVDARQQTINSIKRQIGTNLNIAQQKLGLPNDAAKDFMTFAAERGYSMEDFVDSNLAMKVANDFKNQMNSPEFDRLKSVAAKRQAFTSSVGSSPNAGPASGGDVKGRDPVFDALSSQAQRRRNL